MILQILVLLACALAGVLQFAAIRSPDTSDLSILMTARRITGVVLILAAGYILYCIVEFGRADNMLCILLGLFALGQVLFAMHTFFEPSCTNRLMARKALPPERKFPNEATHA